MNNSLNYIRYHMNRDRNFLILYGIALLCLFPLLALALKTILPPKDSVICLLYTSRCVAKQSGHKSIGIAPSLINL